MNDTPETNKAERMAYSQEYMVPTEVARRLERERDEAREALSEIALYLSVGMGDETTTAQQYQQRILDGIKMLTEPIVDLWKQGEKERDEAREEWGKSSMDAAQLLSEKTKVMSERDEAREEIRDWKRLHDAAERGVDLTIAEGTISDLLKQRDECAAMCGRYKQERDIAEEDATNYHARIIELIAERDEAREALADWENAAAHVEADHPDEKHCGCVPVLRKLLADSKRERDEAREEWGKSSMDAAQLLSEKTKIMAERDEAREKLNTNLVDISNKLVVAIKERDEAIARSKEWSDWCVEYKSELEEAQKDTKILSRRMKTLWDSSEKVCRERDELLKECMQMSIEFGLPPTIRPADGEIRKMINGWKQAMVERDEAREFADRYRVAYCSLRGDSVPTHFPWEVEK